MAALVARKHTRIAYTHETNKATLLGSWSSEAHAALGQKPYGRVTSHLKTRKQSLNPRHMNKSKVSQRF